MLYIEPTECIECQACIPVCPAQAIFDEDDLPPELKVWTSINAERASALPVVSEKQTPLKTDC
jgi:ferredoxin